MKNYGGNRNFSRLRLKKDPFLPNKVATIIFALCLSSFLSIIFREGEIDVYWAVSVLLLFPFIVISLGYFLFIKKRKKVPGILMFPGKFRDGFFFYASLVIDIGIPAFFFFSFALSLFDEYNFDGDILLFGFSLSFILLMIYGYVFTHGFPTQTSQAVRQFLTRIFVLGLMFVFNENILEAFFIYGLFDIVSLSVVFGVFFFMPSLFKDSDGNWNRTFKHNRGTILIAIFPGLPIFLWGVILYSLGFLEVFSRSLDYNYYLQLLVWIGLILPILSTHFQLLRNSDVGLYRHTSKD